MPKHLTLFWRSSNGTKLSDINFLKCYVELCLREGSYENIRENEVGGICIRSTTASRA
jgi:hypothetical protein